MAEFDVAIVGGGAAGCILAARLSENPANRILLIEAGPDFLPDAVPYDIEDTFPSAYWNPLYFWPSLMAEWHSGGAASPFPQARLMGGGSSVMGMWAVRGLPQDYDSWRDAGASGWGWDDVLPSFNRIERDMDFQGPLHGASGAISIRRHPPRAWPPFIRTLADAAATRGLSLHDDINGDFSDGVFPVPVTNDENGRTSSSSGYLTAAVRRRHNLTIQSETLVRHIVFDGRRAVGLEVSGAKENGTIRSRRVILAAGAIGSPAILLRSGVGPANDLKRLGIEPVADLTGVGEHLQNHCIVNLATRIAPHARQHRDLRTYAVACARVSSGHPAGRAGDLQLQFVTKTSLNPHGDRVGIVGVALYGPLSRGRVRLISRDASDPPRVEFRLLEHPADRERLASGIQTAMELLSMQTVREVRDPVFAVTPTSMIRRLNRPGASNKAMSQLLAWALDMPYPIRRFVLSKAGWPVPEVSALKDVGEKLLGFASPVFHPTGTCSIGRRDDRYAVVDAACGVRGIEGVWVADASIMPIIPTGNTCLSTMMIAEHASRMLASALS